VPIYEYVCQACARVSEHMQKVSDPPPDACPACGRGPLVKAVSRTSFQLKGGGWYADLYASSGKGKEAGTAKPAAKPAGGSEAGSGGGASGGGTSGTGSKPGPGSTGSTST
jgi:putative FmdB family regulatory protein